MPIQRTVSLPVPSDAVARARRELAPRYGAQVWDGPDRRVLLVRVPRGEPDPVNDVEEAVEFLASADVKDITHCLLVGDEAVAQVYARPLQDLMRERDAFDRRTAAGWRERLPGHLSHTVFQAPDDPRRRWRLVVRLPLESVRDLDEELLEDLADGMGAELETQRFSQIVAVYLVAGTDDVRLEADLFLQELRAKWQSEEGRRRKQLQAAQREAEEQRRREQERRQVVREMETRLARTKVPRHARFASAEQASPVEDHVQPARALEKREDMLDAASRGLSSASDATAPRRLPGASEATAPRRLHGSSPARPESRQEGDLGPVATQDDDQPVPLAEAATVIRARPADSDPSRPARLKSLQVPHRVRELRARVDQAIKGKPARPDPAAAPADAQAPRAAASAAQASQAPTRSEAPPSDPSMIPEQTAAGLSMAAGQGAEMPAAAAGMAAEPETSHAESTEQPPAPSVPVLPVLRSLQGRLEEAGFETIVSPPTAGHVIDLAAERPEGDVQRIVVRAVERLDPDTAKELLKTARDLEVDLVLCVADAIQHEALRLLVATKVTVVRPEETEKVEF